MTIKHQTLAAVDRHAPLLASVARQIWDFAELSLQEHRSAELYQTILTEQGFAVETNLAGIATAFSGSFGSGRPVIGFLAEFDALSGLSQAAGATLREELIPGGNGHGCGHHLLGAGALGAALAYKEYLETSGVSGTVIFYGCPGEEGGAGKAFMAREGLWNHLDAALTWHPDDVNEVVSGTCNSCIQKEYVFQGVASHAASGPENGRSALDAVTLMNLGVEFLREHMRPSSRIHYAITNTGGLSPNVIQPFAKVLYMVRDIDVTPTLALQARVDKIAEAAAMMTETKLTVRFIDGTSNTVPNFTLEKVLFDNFKEVTLPEYSPAEWDYAAALSATIENKPDKLPGDATKYDPTIRSFVANASNDGAKVLNDYLIPQFSSHQFEFGSTDVGDVSWLTPTAQIHTVCYPSGTPFHTWQMVSCGATSIATKGMLTAAKVLACTAVDLHQNPDILAAAKVEFTQQAKAGYTCPIPPDAVPTIV